MSEEKGDPPSQADTTRKISINIPIQNNSIEVTVPVGKLGGVSIAASITLQVLSEFFSTHVSGEATSLFPLPILLLPMLALVLVVGFLLGRLHDDNDE